MKTRATTRRFLRRTSLNREAGIFKKEGRSEESFFGGTHHEPFFRPRPPAVHPKTSTHSAPANRVQSVHIANSVKGTVQRQPDPLPNFSQGDFDSCGAASIVAAIMIQDRQASTGGVANNSGFLAAANIVLSYYSMHQSEVIAGLEARKRLSHQQATDLYWNLRTILMSTRENSRLPGAAVTEHDYQYLSAAIYALYVASTSGLSQAAIGSITNLLGVSMTSAGGLESYTSIITHPSLAGLAPGQVAQIGWYVRVGATGVNMHAFLI